MRATIVLLAALLVAGCGGGGGKSKGLPGKDNPAVKKAAQAYLDAYTAKDPKAICDTLTPRVRRQLADNKGSCIRTMAFSIRNAKSFPTLKISQARSQGNVALAQVAGIPRQISLELIYGHWLVSNGGL